MSSPLSRRGFLAGMAAAATSLAVPRAARGWEVTTHADLPTIDVSPVCEEWRYNPLLEQKLNRAAVVTCTPNDEELPFLASGSLFRHGAQVLCISSSHQTQMENTLNTYVDEQGRAYMETAPSPFAPSGYKAYPLTMDSTSCGYLAEAGRTFLNPANPSLDFTVSYIPQANDDLRARALDLAPVLASRHHKGSGVALSVGFPLGRRATTYLAYSREQGWANGATTRWVNIRALEFYGMLWRKDDNPLQPGCSGSVAVDVKSGLPVGVMMGVGRSSAELCNKESKALGTMADFISLRPYLVEAVRQLDAGTPRYLQLESGKMPEVCDDNYRMKAAYRGLRHKPDLASMFGYGSSPLNFGTR